MKKTLLQLLLFFMGGATFAQQTGSFDTQITFMGQSRTLSCYVPTTYDSTAALKLMVGLHGLGDNSTNYRNALINSLNWETTYPNTIFVFPDGGSDQNRDFYSPSGDEAIIAEAMDYAMQHYWIDSSYVVLQGFSLGGRSAVKYGLDNPSLFKGLLLNTPAFQGWQDAHNIPPYSLGFNYNNASQIPIYITVGDADLYYYMLETLVPELKAQDAIINYNPVAGLGHTVPGAAITAPVYPFFDKPAGAAIDLDVFDIEMPQRTCATVVDPKVFVQNKSDSVITSIELNYQFGASTGTELWSGSLNAYEHAEITLSALATASGSQNLSVSLGSINGMYTDTVSADNAFADTLQVEFQGAALPLTEGFEGNSPQWVFNETGTMFEWYTDASVKKSGNASIANFNTILLFNTQGNVESFESPLLDLTTSTSPELTFDVAYNYHRYTPPYLTVDTSFADTLEIVISTDCGQTWQSVYKMGGADLATANTPITNALNLNQALFNPGPSQWRSDTVNLQSFGTSTGAIVKFNYISALGGSIYIDNISFGDPTISIEENKAGDLVLYPNPTNNVLNISYPNVDLDKLTIYNTAGTKVLEQGIGKDLNGMTQIDVSALKKGVYILTLSGDRGPVTKRFMKSGN